MTKNKWTYQECYKEAEKYNTRKSFQKGSNGAYKASLRNKWIDDYFWFIKPEAYNKKWDYETCKKEAEKYTTLGDYRKFSGKAYQISLKNGWIEEFTWLERKKGYNNYWDYEKCFQESKKYPTRTDFRKKSPTCYKTCLDNGWLDEFVWIPKRKQILSKWTKEICFSIGKRFTTKRDFAKYEKGCYTASLRNKWIDEMTWFVPASIENVELFKKTHLVYVYIDESLNVAYVGLTSNLKSRHARHKKKGSVYDYFSNKGLPIPEPKILKDNLTPEESRFYEDFYLNIFKEKGYEVLNKAKTGRYCGSFGGGRVKYTYDVCYEIAKRYNTLKDFYKNEQSCYNRTRQKGWLKEYKWLKKERNV